MPLEKDFVELCVKTGGKSRKKEENQLWGRQRYTKIHQYFHLANSEQQPERNADNYDPLYKVRPLLDQVRSVCSTVYKPKQNLSVDEAMVAFTGRISFKQYLKNKPTPWGFKIWCCAEAECGYLLNFQVYTGKNGNHQPTEHGQGHQVVTNMVQNHLGKNHSVFFDNFFSSVKLAEDLLKEKTTRCGTIRPNRKDLVEATPATITISTFLTLPKLADL
ncbi:PiggyBac transposable element-derived protein 4-like [Elysia marginata]|uniref:PiggyBac transposable element-derived protein 4-like n=1 Tax=Elysia marginata TaxID=1093978 RepID=A0AAV4F5E4_9GAST|nr:PiggyBac transposable element-derived protein 4-like [Elysia marginata]